MINKEDAKNKGFQIIETSNHLKNQKQNLIAELKKLLPELISEDTLNLETLKNLLSKSLGSEILTDSKLGYELNFVGKSIARAEADEDTKMCLSLNQNQSKNLATTDNIVIKGDNIDALKILKQNYQNKIKMIYIDPPYNTGSDSFIYKDYYTQTPAELKEKYNLMDDTIKYYENVYASKTHSGWLAFMYPRLKLARDLLKDDGCIFISIDDNEQANLKIIMDEIFGEENFVACIIWKKRTVKNDAPNGVSTDTEYILCYSKNNDYFLGGRDFEKQYYKTDDYEDEWRLNPFTKHNTASERPNSNFTVINPKNGEKWEPNPNRVWRITKDTFPDYYNKGKVVFPGDYNFLKISSPMLRIFKKEDIDKKAENFNRASISNYLDMQTVGGTGEGTKIIDSLFGAKIFSFPKPIKLIEKLSELLNTQTHDIILDFFAGSGTTGHAVMELNKKDGGNRKFILVQKNEPITEKSEAYKFCEENNFEKVISSITIERLNRAGDKIKKENPLIENLDIGYKVFDLVKEPSLEIKNNNTELFIENNYKSSINAFYAMLTKTDKLLSTKFQELTKNIFLIINDAVNNQESTTELNNIELYITNIQDKEDKDILQKYQNSQIQIYLNGFANISLDTHLTYFKKENTKIIF